MWIPFTHPHAMLDTDVFAAFAAGRFSEKKTYQISPQKKTLQKNMEQEMESIQKSTVDVLIWRS